jgi:hypothetical protein
MAQLTPTITTAAISSSTLVKAYRKMQGALLMGFQSMSEEWDLFDEIPTYDLTISAREMTVPIRVYGAGRSAMIAEGALEKNPVTPPLEELTLTWANLNERWMTTLTARYLDSKAQAGQIIRQLRYQAMEALEAISNTVSWQFYGFSTGVACQTTTVATQARAPTRWPTPSVSPRWVAPATWPACSPLRPRGAHPSRRPGGQRHRTDHRRRPVAVPSP